MWVVSEAGAASPFLTMSNGETRAPFECNAKLLQDALSDFDTGSRDALVAGDPGALRAIGHKARRCRAAEHRAAVSRPGGGPFLWRRSLWLGSAAARRAGSRSSGAALHDPARLRPRFVLQVASHQ